MSIVDNGWLKGAWKGVTDQLKEKTLMQQAAQPVDGVWRSRLRRLERGQQTLKNGELVTPSGPYSSISNSVLDSTGGLNFTNLGIVPTGNIAPNIISGGFAYTCTETTLTWYWDGTNGSSRMLIRRTNGTRVPIPAGSQLITGLTALTKYYHLPFWNSASNSCTIGWVGGTVGSPAISFLVNTDVDALQQQLGQTRDQLWSGWLDGTTAAGGGGTGGGGGGGNDCVMHGCTDVEPLAEGDSIMALYPQSEWIRLVLPTGVSLTCTPDHIVYTEAGKRMAKDCTKGDSMITKWGFMPLFDKQSVTIACQKEKWEVPGHAMWCNGFLSHNQKVAPL